MVKLVDVVEHGCKLEEKLIGEKVVVEMSVAELLLYKIIIGVSNDDEIISFVGETYDYDSELKEAMKSLLKGKELDNYKELKQVTNETLNKIGLGGHIKNY